MTVGKLVKTGSKYSDLDRRRAVIEYCVAGNMTKVAKLVKIPRRTLAEWKQSEWWDEEVAKVRHEINDEILAQNLQIATKASERVLDSLENGDEKLVWDKDKGEHVVIRLRPSGKEAAVMGGISQDKARVQLYLPTVITSKSAGMEALARRFQELSEQVERDRNVVSVQEQDDSGC